MRIVNRFAVALAVGALTVSVAPSAFAADSDRLAGSDRYETAIAVSKKFTNPEVVFLARGDNQADAVTGGKLPGGPLLLVSDATDVREKVADQVKALAPKKIVVLGGTGAVSEATVTAVAGSIPVTRLSGASRYETAAKISGYLNTDTVKRVYLANGQTLVDALVGGSIKDNGPILLTDGSGTLPQATIDEIKRLKPSEVVALGGEKAVLPAELTAAATVNGAGGGLSKDQAIVKATADRVKAIREAEMQVKGYLTVAAGKTVDDFFGANGPKSASAVKADVATTFPKVLASDVDTTSTVDGWFAVDGDTDPKSAADAVAAQTYQDTLGGNPVKGFKGYDAANAGTKSAPTDVAAAKNALATAVDGVVKAATPADATTAVGDTLAKAIANQIGVAVIYVPGTGAPITKTTPLSDLAKALGITATFPVTADNAAAQQTLYKNALNALVDKQAVTKSAIAAKAATATAEQAKLNAAGTTPTESEVQKYMGGSGATASRISGATRFLTALEIAKTAYPSGSGAKAVYVANGFASADATVAGFIDNKAELAGPVLLVEKESVPTEVVDYLKAAKAANTDLAGTSFKALGGLGVIADSVITTVKGALS